VINMLIDERALVPAGADRGPTHGWADPVEHARMFHDDRRTGDYLRALAEAVRPGDVVLDIGTGSGVVAIAAARAGARRVYAVEASDIAEVADRVFAINGVQDKVTLIPGWSRHIDLPEPADLLVSELIGNEPFEEEILETTLDARRRLLKPGARRLLGRGVHDPELGFGAGCGGVGEEQRDEACPSGLVAGAEAGAVVAVEVFVELEQLAPVGIGLESFDPSEHGPVSVLAAGEDRGQAPADLAGDLAEVHLVA
jgi:SAM-dependent methyltransferase